MRKNPPHEQRELGFGSRSTANLQRALEKDGSFNFKRTGENFFGSFELFHWLVSITWGKFILVVTVCYTVVNILFALLYLWAGADGITGMEYKNSTDRFWEIFFFSSQTLTTLGYGRMAPVGHMASAIAAVESMFGLMAFALVTGLLYGRFSKAKAKILYSKNAVIAPYRGISGFMFRIVNKKASHLIELEADLVVSMLDREGKTRIFEALPLERSKINFFTLSWTIVHPLDENSPLYGMTKEELERSGAEFIIMIKGFDEGFSQTIYSRSSYLWDEVIWGAKFNTMIGIEENGKRIINMEKLNDFEPAELPAMTMGNK